MAEKCLDNQPALWRDALPEPAEHGQKYDRGHVLVIGGYPMTGAARLASLAAARAGAGLTTVAVPGVAFPIYATSLTSIMVYPLIGDDALEQLLIAQSFTALLIGPGAGVGAETRAGVKALLATALPTVIDADAMTCFSEDKATLFDALRENCVLTPHEGEFERLFDVRGSRPERASSAALASGAVIVLKGHHTIIAAPDGRTIINRNAPPSLATAGSGDVLAGIICGLLAQGMDSFRAAAAGVWMHGAAASAFGRGLIADDLPDLLPGVFRRIDSPAEFKAGGYSA